MIQIGDFDSRILENMDWILGLSAVQFLLIIIMPISLEKVIKCMHFTTDPSLKLVEENTEYRKVL